MLLTCTCIYAYMRPYVYNRKHRIFSSSWTKFKCFSGKAQLHQYFVFGFFFVCLCTFDVLLFFFTWRLGCLLLCIFQMFHFICL